MRQDTILNLAVMIFIVLIVLLLSLTTRYSSSKKLEMIAKVRKELKLISEKIENYRAKYNRYPTSLDEKNFVLLISEISVFDPFDPEKKNYRYKIENGHWKINSVGPNKIDDNGISSKESKLLDIVFEGNGSAFDTGYQVPVIRHRKPYN